MRVRFLHANVRRRLKDSSKWNAAEWGIPWVFSSHRGRRSRRLRRSTARRTDTLMRARRINQEDTIGTLMAFSASVVHSLKMLIGISEADERDYLRL